MDAPSRSQREEDRGRRGKFRPLSSALCAVKTPEPQRSRSTRRKTLTTLRALCALCDARLFGPWLLDLGLGAGVDQLLQNRFRVRFGHAFLDGLGRSIHQVLGFLQTEPGDFADRLDHVDLVFAEPGEHDRELGLFFHRRGSSATARRSGRRNRHRCSGHAELVFKVFDQLRQLQHRHVGNRIQNLCFCYRHFVSPESVSLWPHYCALAACRLLRTAARVRAKRAGTSFSVRTNCAIGACIVARTFASSSSRDGISASAVTSFAEITAFGTAPARMTSFSFALANSLSTLAVATGSGEMP